MTAEGLQRRIQEAVHELIDGGAETGVQVSVIRHGAVVADVAAGVADPAVGRPVSPGTLFWAASTAKGMASTVVHIPARPAGMYPGSVFGMLGGNGSAAFATSTAAPPER